MTTLTIRMMYNKTGDRLLKTEVYEIITLLVAVLRQNIVNLSFSILAAEPAHRRRKISTVDLFDYLRLRGCWR
jgi:hypothetical protein